MRSARLLVLAVFVAAVMLPAAALGVPADSSGVYLTDFSAAYPGLRQLAVVNISPVASADSTSTTEDIAGTFDVLANDTDADSGPAGLTIDLSGAVAPGHGSVSIVSGKILYTPVANYNGGDLFTYRAYDGLAYSDYATVTVAVAPVNDVPAAVADTSTVAEDTTLTIAAPGLVANDSDADGDTLTAYAVSAVGHGTIYLGTNGGVVYRPFPDWFGTETFTYRVFDGTVYSAPATVTITVTAVNDAPVAAADAATATANTTLTVPAPGVLANDADIETSALTATVIAPPSHGTLQLATNGGFTYRANADWTGTDSFTYSANDGTVLSPPTVVTIAVVPNGPPVAAADTMGLGEDTTLTVPAPGVLENDTDATPGGALTAHLLSDTAHGVLSLSSDGSYTYRPAANWSGTDEFTYRAHDGQVFSAPATVTINVNPVNDPPVAVNDATTAKEGRMLTVPAPGLLANDTDFEGSALSVSLNTSPLHGTVSIGAGGAYTYEPTAGWVGIDTFTYRASDGSLYSNVATVTVTVTPRDATVTSRASAAATISYGSSYTFKGRVTASGTPVWGVDVLLEKSSNGTTFTAAEPWDISASDGRFSIKVSPKSKTWYRARFPGNADFAESTSTAVAVSVRASVGTPVAPKTAKRNKSFRVYGSLKPRHTAGTSAVRVYRYRLEGRTWKSYGYVTVKVYDYSTYSRYSTTSLRLAKKGKWRLRAYHADAGHAKAWSSKYDYVTVK